ncbi:MAG: hypothetical protein AAFW69_02025 [Pseudomonadota bacterium]
MAVLGGVRVLPPPRVVSLWIGPRLGPLGRLCLRSHVLAGHPVELYSYTPVADLPEGVVARDAADVMPLDAELLERGGPRLIADIWRLEMLAAGRGIWIDCDALALHPLGRERRLFGLVTETMVATGILRLPRSSRALAMLRAFIADPWDPMAKRFARKRLRALGITDGREALLAVVARRPTFVGPEGLTFMLRKTGEIRAAMAPERLYPVGFGEVEMLFGPDAEVRARIRPETLSVHLYNGRLGKRRLPLPPPPGSFLAVEAARCGVDLAEP